MAHNGGVDTVAGAMGCALEASIEIKISCVVRKSVD